MRQTKLRQQNLKQVFLFLGVVAFAFIWWWTKPVFSDKGSVFIYDRNGEKLYESVGNSGRRNNVRLSNIPQDLINTVLVVEDKRYYQHRGVDLISVWRAIQQNIKSRKIVSGASTITQQLVRSEVISPNELTKTSWLRKIREALMAIRLELSHDKDWILERYLNNVALGRGVYGVESASQLYFGKPASMLSVGEGALLSGMIANPARFDPLNQIERAIERKEWVLEQLKAQKIIDDEALERAQKESIPIEIFENQFIAPHAVEEVLRQVKDLNLPLKENLNIWTTIDSGWYQLSKDIATNQIQQLGIKHNLTNAAVVILENETGQIVSMLGSVDYFDETIEGQNNMALALRQPGSAMKPIIYAAAFDRGLATPATVIDDVAKSFLTKKGEGFVPHNYDGLYRGPVLIREALASSYNLPAVEVLSWVGVNQWLDFASDFGVTSMKDHQRYDLALALGGGEISLTELSNAYATLARGGEWLPISIINRVEDHHGQVLWNSLDQTVATRRAVKKTTAWLITDILSDPKARIPAFGEKNPLTLQTPAAVKTGTTTDWHDNWTIGYTQDYTVGVWVGNANNQPMTDLTGVTGAAPIWQQVIESLINFEEYRQFEKPEGLVEVEVCSWDGLLPNQECSERYFEWFEGNTQPREQTPLKEKPKRITDKVGLVDPKNQTTYKLTQDQPSTIVFEVTSHPKISGVSWFLNGELVSCLVKTRTTCSWAANEGVYLLKTEIELENELSKSVDEVKFRVIGVSDLELD